MVFSKVKRNIEAVYKSNRLICFFLPSLVNDFITFFDSSNSEEIASLCSQ